MSEADCTAACTSVPESEPIAESASTGPTKQPHPVYADRWADGTMRPSNTLSLVHGGFSRQASALQAPYREEIRRRVIADLGGDESGLPVTLVSLVDRFAETTLLCEAYITWLQDQGGPIGTRGRQKAAVRGYLACLDRMTKLAQLLGLERKPKRLPSLADVMNADE